MRYFHILLIISLSLMSCSAKQQQSHHTELHGALHLQHFERSGSEEQVRCNAPEQLTVNYVLEDATKQQTIVHTPSHAPLTAHLDDRSLHARYETEQHSQSLTFTPFSQKAMIVSVTIVSNVLKDTQCTYQYSGKLPSKVKKG